MKKSTKRITGAIMAAAIFAAMTVMSTTASASYIDGDREVDYYNFDIEANCDLDLWSDPNNPTEPIVKRFADRNWVVSVNKVNYNYKITYMVCRIEGNGGLGITEEIAAPAKMGGTGNTGGRYYGNYKGSKIRFRASKAVDAPDGTLIKTQGQWSPDSPY